MTSKWSSKVKCRTLHIERGKIMQSDGSDGMITDTKNMAAIEEREVYKY